MPDHTSGKRPSNNQHHIVVQKTTPNYFSTQIVSIAIIWNEIFCEFPFVHQHNTMSEMNNTKVNISPAILALFFPFEKDIQRFESYRRAATNRWTKEKEMLHCVAFDVFIRLWTKTIFRTYKQEIVNFKAANNIEILWVCAFGCCYRFLLFLLLSESRLRSFNSDNFNIYSTIENDRSKLPWHLVVHKCYEPLICAFVQVCLRHLFSNQIESAWMQTI